LFSLSPLAHRPGELELLIIVATFPLEVLPGAHIVTAESTSIVAVESSSIVTAESTSFGLFLASQGCAPGEASIFFSSFYDSALFCSIDTFIFFLTSFFGRLHGRATDPAFSTNTFIDIVALSLLLSGNLRNSLLPRLLSSHIHLFNLQQLQLLLGKLNDFLLRQFSLLVSKLLLLGLVLLMTPLQKLLSIRLKRILSRHQLLLGLQFFGMLIFDGLGDVFHFLGAVLFAILFHRFLFFFMQGAGPDLHVVDFFVLFSVEVGFFLSEE